MERTVIVILGPTGSGKSKLSISLAKKIGGEIVSCDSMQIYRRMDIGTAKISKKEMENIPHHMIDIVDPNEEFSVGEYVKQAKQIAEDARIALRNARQDANNDIKKADDMTEDDKKDGQEDVQELINRYNKIIDEKLKVKEEELMSV